MAWSEAARAQHGRPHDDGQDDPTDAEWMVIAPLIPRQGRMGRPGRRTLDGCSMRSGPCCRRDVGGGSFRPVIRRLPRSGTVLTSGGMTRPRNGGRTRFAPWRGRRQAVAWRRRGRSSTEDDGRRRAFGTGCRQEDQGTETAHRGGRGRQPDRGACAPGRRAGSGWCAGRDRGPPEQGSGVLKGWVPGPTGCATG